MTMRNWPLFRAPKKPIVIDLFGWMEDPWAKAVRERADKGKGWARYWSTKPCLNIPEEPSQVPFRKSLLHHAVVNVIVGHPRFVEATYVTQTFDISESCNSGIDEGIFLKMWEIYNA